MTYISGHMHFQCHTIQNRSTIAQQIQSPESGGKKRSSICKAPAKIQATAIILKQDIRRNILPKFLMIWLEPIRISHVAALVRSHKNGLLPFESTTEKTTETMPLALQQ